jgi:hypothetical protein
MRLHSRRRFLKPLAIGGLGMLLGIQMTLSVGRVAHYYFANSAAFNTEEGGAVRRPVSSSESFYMAPGTKRMAERLAKIAEEAEANPENNPFLNDKRAEVLRALLKQPMNPDKELELRISMGQELLWAGKSQEAAEIFRELRQRVNQPGIKVSAAQRSMIQTFLAVSYLRIGEQENCIGSHTSDSCLLPIRSSGVHRFQSGSRHATEEFSTILKDDPDDLSARWLLNIAYMTLGEYPEKVPEDFLIPEEAFRSEYDLKQFHDIAPGLGLATVNHSGGAIMEDLDGDGYLDIMTSGSHIRDPLHFYHNNADGTFSERTTEAGLSGLVGGLNLIHADYNNDGYPDVFVLRGAWMKKGGHHPDSLLRNNGNGTFADVTEEAGLLSFHPSQTAAWGDYDNDGWLDLFIGNESDPQDPHPSELFHNNGDGTFTECVAAVLGVADLGYVKGVVWGDYDNDGRLDLYVSRLGRLNALFHNNGPAQHVELAGAGNSSQQGVHKKIPSWSFTDVSVRAKVLEPSDSFPTWFWDYDNDGWLDIFVSGWRALGGVGDVAADYLGLPHRGEPPRLYRNNRNGTFSNVTGSAKLNKLLLTMGCNFGDLDNDGFLDFYLGTGSPDLGMLTPNRMFRNAEGKFFQDVTSSGGFGHLQKGHGVAFGDIDNDGDQDIYEVMGGAYSGDTYMNVLFENPGHGNHWITLKLEGVRSNRSAIGARIHVRLRTPHGDRDVYSTVSTGGSFGSSSLQQEIGLGQAASILFIEISWPTTTKTQVFKNVAMDQMLKIREGDLEPVPINLKHLDFSSARGHSKAASDLHHIHSKP